MGEQQGQAVRQFTRGLALLCAMVALGDILLHPLQFQENHDDGLGEWFDESAMMLLRWKTGQANDPGENELIAGVAGALHLDQSKFSTQAFLQNHRTWIFKYNRESGETGKPMHTL